MQHARIAVYTVSPGKSDEVIEKAQQGMLPIFQGQPGFVGYGLVKTDQEHVIVSLSFWETEEEAESAVALAADWVRDNIAQLITLQANHVGDLSFFSAEEPVGA